MEGRLEDVRILIVDDDRDVAESIDHALQSEGASTMVVQDGNAAVAACLEDPPDIVVLDMMLPKRSGFLVLEKIKGHEDSPLVIMITANEGKRHQAYAESLGVDKYLLKPVPLELLIDSAVELLDKQDAEDGWEDDDEGDEDGESAPPPSDVGAKGKPKAGDGPAKGKPTGGSGGAGGGTGGRKKS